MKKYLKVGDAYTLNTGEAWLAWYLVDVRNRQNWDGGNVCPLSDPSLDQISRELVARAINLLGIGAEIAACRQTNSYFDVHMYIRSRLKGEDDGADLNIGGLVVDVKATDWPQGHPAVPRHCTLGKGRKPDLYMFYTAKMSTMTYTFRGAITYADMIRKEHYDNKLKSVIRDAYTVDREQLTYDIGALVERTEREKAEVLNAIAAGRKEGGR